MSADFYIRTIKNDPEVIAAYNRVSKADFSISHINPDKDYVDDEGFVHSRIPNDDSIGLTVDEWKNLYRIVWRDSYPMWIGQVSWLGADMTSDDQKYTPSAVFNIDKIFAKYGPIIKITPKMITQIMVAMNDKSSSIYEKHHRAEGYSENKGAMVPRRNRKGYQPYMRTKNYGTSGVNSRRMVKKWLESHMGEMIICETD